MRRASHWNGARLRAGLRACQGVTKRPTPTTWTWQAERGPRARTYRLLMSEALALVRRGRIPSVAEVALNAGVSRATAYRYFPSRSTLVTAVLEAALRPVRRYAP